MKNPAKPGDFGANGTRGVVGSGMSETTKRAIPTDLMDLGTRWAERVDATHLIAKPVPYHAARANLRVAGGGAERETTKLTGGNWSALYEAENGSCEDVSLCCCDPVHSRIDLGSGWLLDRMGRCRLVRLGRTVPYGLEPCFWGGGGLMAKRAWTAEEWQAFRASPKLEAKEELVSPETEQGRQAADRTILTALGFHAEQFGEFATEASLLRLMRRTLIDIRTIPALRKYLHGMAERSLVSQAGYGRWEAV